MKFPNKEDNSSEIGAALITSILALLLATLLGFALITVGMGAMEITNNGIQQTEAFYIADSGLAHASALINKVKRQNYSTILTTGDATANTGDELSAPPDVGLWAATDNIPAGNNTAGGVTFGTGRYYVTVRNDSAAGETATRDANGILIVRSTGVGRDGSTATVEGIVKTEPFNVPGLLANGDVQFTDTIEVLGPAGMVQINGDPTLPGMGHSTCAELEFQITGNPVVVANTIVGPLCNIAPVVGTTILFNQPRAVPPIIDVAKLRSDFKPSASWVFKNNGEIYPQINGVERVLALSAFEKTALGLDQWSYNGGGNEWRHNGAPQRLPDGNYYFWDSNVSISKGGDPVNPPRVTVFAEGSISLNNSIALQPNFPGYSLVSANDIVMSSNFGNTTNSGLIYAYGQVKFSNTANILGGVVAADFYLPDGTFGPDANAPGVMTSPVNRNQGVMQFSGDVTITTLNLGNLNGARTISWREVRF